VLAVVDHDQRPPPRQIIHGSVERVAPRQLPHTKHSGQRRRDQLALCEWGELDPPHAVRERVERVGGGLGRQPRLAAPARAGKRKHSRRAQRTRNLSQLALSPDEARQLVREVVRQRVERAQRLGARWQIRMAEREHVLRPPKIAQPMCPEVNQLYAVGQPLDDQIMYRTRDQRLSTMRDRAQPPAAAQRDAEVVALVAQLRLCSVQRDPDPQLEIARPRLPRERQLSLERRHDRIRRPGERRHHAVALPFSTGRTPLWRPIASDSSA
jgi:hypothetical protein